MSENPMHEVLECTNPVCAFRFPLSPTEKRLTRCPRCGSPLHSAEMPYHSFAVPCREKKTKKHSYAAVLDNIRSTYNVGAMFRTSDGAGIDKLYLCGITPTPEHPKVGKTALGAELSVPWESVSGSLDIVRKLKTEGYYTVALEGGSDSKNIFKTLPEIQQMDTPIALIVGNEVSGVDPEVIRECSACVYIPMEGIKESLNVAIAFGIAAYLIRYQGINHE